MKAQSIFKRENTSDTYILVQKEMSFFQWFIYSRLGAKGSFSPTETILYYCLFFVLWTHIISPQTRGVGPMLG